MQRSRLVLAAWAILAMASTMVRGAEAPPPRDLRLLDDTPNILEVLEHQWSDGLPQDITGATQDAEHYGLLLGSGGAPVTTLNECVALALQNNSDLQIQRLTPVSARSQVRQARSIFDPRLFTDVTRDRLVTPATTFLTAGQSDSLFQQNFTLNAGLRKTLLTGGQFELKWTNRRTVTNPSIANLLVPSYTTGLGVSLVQPLLRDFGWRYSTLMVRLAQNTEQATYHQYEAAISTLVATVERAYWALVLSIQNVVVQEQGLVLAKELLRQNEGKFNVGALPRTAVLEAQSEVARREANLLRARNLNQDARNNLRALVNARSGDAPNLVMIEPRDTPSATSVEVDLDGSLQAALRLRPEIQAARLDIEGRGLQRKLAENQLLPRFNFVGGIGVNGLSGSRPVVNFGDGQVQANPNLDGGYGDSLALLPDGRFYNYSAGAVVEIPIANAQARADYSQANINVERSKLSLQKLQESVTLEVAQAVSSIDTDLKSIDATRLARELAEENVRNQQARYDVGLATTKDLLDFQDKLTQARFAEIEALTRYNADLAELRRVEGTLLSARSIVVDRGQPEDAPWWAWF